MSNNEIKLGSKWRLKQVVLDHLDIFSIAHLQPNVWILAINQSTDNSIYLYPGKLLITKEELTTYYEQVEEPKTCMVKGYKLAEGKSYGVPLADDPNYLAEVIPM